jgi:hypothetical protein
MYFSVIILFTGPMINGQWPCEAVMVVTCKYQSFNARSGVSLQASFLCGTDPLSCLHCCNPGACSGEVCLVLIQYVSCIAVV